MNRLWVFGDNSSCIFDKTGERRFEYYKRYRSGIFPPSWSQLLSNKLNLKLNNFAVSGQSNYDIFEWFSKCSPLIKENDLVLIGWGNLQTYRLFDEYSNNLISIRPNAITTSNKVEILNGISLNTIDELTKNRKHNRWEDEITAWEILITEFCKLKKCKVFYWTFDKNLNKSYYLGGDNVDFYNYLKSLGAEDITSETNGLLIDNHFGEKGQQIQSNYFYDILKTYSNE
jgi:hypothetical protein